MPARWVNNAEVVCFQGDEKEELIGKRRLSYSDWDLDRRSYDD